MWWCRSNWGGKGLLGVNVFCACRSCAERTRRACRDGRGVVGMGPGRAAEPAREAAAEDGDCNERGLGLGSETMVASIQPF